MFAQPLSQQVHETFALNPYLSQSGLHFQADEGSGKVVLQGRVNSYYEKQMAQEAVRDIKGVQLIQNDLEVR